MWLLTSLWHRLFDLLKHLQKHRFHCKTNTLSCCSLVRSKCHWFFMFFQSRCWGPFVEGPCADLYWNIGFGYHFRFSFFSKRRLSNYLFLSKADLSLPGGARRSVLVATLLPPNQSDLLCLWTYWLLKGCFFCCSRLTHFRFFMFFCVVLFTWNFDHRFS